MELSTSFKHMRKTSKQWTLGVYVHSGMTIPFVDLFRKQMNRPNIQFRTCCIHPLCWWCMEKNVLQTVMALVKTRPIDRFIHLCCASQSCQAYKNNDFLNSTEVKRFRVLCRGWWTTQLYSPKYPDPSKVPILRTRTPAIQVPTPPLEGPRILREGLFHKPWNKDPLLNKQYFMKRPFFFFRGSSREFRIAIIVCIHYCIVRSVG